MIEELYKFKKYLNKAGVILSFTGPFTQDFLSGIGEVMRQNMKLEKVGSFFSVFIEQTQNIMHYSKERLSEAQDEDKSAIGIVLVGYANEHYFVTGGNVIENSKVDNLRDKLAIVQKMNKDELKKYYKEQRRSEPEEGSKGAGLGFIEIARRTAEPIEFDFNKIDEKNSFFSFEAVI